MVVSHMGSVSADILKLFVDRDASGRIVNAWEEAKHERHEALPIDNAELQEFLAVPVARFDAAIADQSRWG